MPLDLSSARSRPRDRVAASGGATLSWLPPAARFILRGPPAAIVAAGAAFGVPLPDQACRAATEGRRAALWLGPDEWLLLAPEADGPALAVTLDRAMGVHPHSLVDVSHRQTGIEISGPRAEPILNAGCPLDLDPAGFPLGMCTRTVLAKVEIVLWRTAPEIFHIEVWRSFSTYAWGLLAEAAREFKH